MKILQNFVAFSEYMNFTKRKILFEIYPPLFCHSRFLKFEYCTVEYQHALGYNVVCKTKAILSQCTEVCFASFLSGGFITAVVVNPPERKLAKHTSEQCGDLYQPIQKKKAKYKHTVNSRTGAHLV